MVLTSSVPHIENFFDKYGDPRVAAWPLMSNPLPILTIMVTYIYFVKILGPRLMEDKKPFELKNTILVYNLFQVLLSFYIFYQAAGWLTGEYNFLCEPMDYSNNPRAIREMNVCGLYFLSKFTELLETIFFVMRRKFDQVSVLHVYHHSTMLLVAWFGFKFAPGGQVTFSIFLNSFVHVLMYGYYFLSALGPEVRRYLWWKKYLTKIQMVQFVLCMVHLFQVLFTDCAYPNGIAVLIGLQVCMFFFLFKNFYDKAYSEKQSKSKNPPLD